MLRREKRHVPKWSHTPVEGLLAKEAEARYWVSLQWADKLAARAAKRQTWSLWVPGKIEREVRLLTDAEYGVFDRAQRSGPQDIYVDTSGVPRRLWLFNDAWYWADVDLDADDVVALVTEDETKKRLRLEKAHALQAMRAQLDAKARRQPIPQDVKVLVWLRDGGRCAECGSQENLEYDHVIPLAMGGSNTDRNLQLLCEVCNRRKGATLG